MRRGDASDAALALEMHVEGRRFPNTFERCVMHGELLPDVPYTLLFASDAAHHLAAAEIVGAPEGPDGEHSVEAVKWGVIFAGGGSGAQLVERAERRLVAVAYLGAGEVRPRSLPTKRCVQEFERTRARGDTQIWGCSSVELTPILDTFHRYHIWSEYSTSTNACLDAERED
ncbi:hypothetical protein PsYK624_114190 [Phanerochaete sordida]|uniref:Uncharacterized protein n=1 Tax=Phanerochaete sordida TaxID=48140 RepID=A0A9P3GHQ3_9APHY|nr:hypothetical protein PsYK624_114190 [Phanerochaete sordida]